MSGWHPRRGMVLAAGLGLRLRPLTDQMPKPMVPVAGRSLIDRALDRFAEVPVETCVVNLHHKAEMLKAHLAARTMPHLLFSDETDALLETGGGVAKALPLLGSDAFYVANSDVLWTGAAMTRLAQFWDGRRMDALLLLHPCATASGYDGAGDFYLETDGRLRRRGQNPSAPFLFAGVQILHPGLFTDLPEGKFSLNILFDRALAAGRLFGIIHDGEWFHVGTANGLALAEKTLR
ncbi:MAG: nucleotidyltransferase family protein [Alphaproteobacteria bacterium]|nr:nucleotidyltransferase family protein [Alphaproteobacteria bacterium]